MMMHAEDEVVHLRELVAAQDELIAILRLPVVDRKANRVYDVHVRIRNAKAALTGD